MSSPWQKFYKKGKKKNYHCVCVCVGVGVWVCGCGCVNALTCSVMSNSTTPGTVARQAPLSTEFSRQEYWSRLPLLLNSERRCFLPKIWERGKKMFTLITYLNTIWEVLASAKNARIGNKRHIDEKGKKKKKLPPFADYMIVFVENSKEPTKTKKTS